MLHVCIFVEESEYIIEELDSTDFLNEIVIQNVLDLIEKNQGKVTFTLCQKHIFGIQDMLSKLYATEQDAVFVDLNARLHHDFLNFCEECLSECDVLYDASEKNFFILMKNEVVKTMLDDEDDKLSTDSFLDLVGSLAYKYNVKKI
ncbi:MAG: hypothetical protein VW270_13190 [Candidatus Poseidoniales archaeon]